VTTEPPRISPAANDPPNPPLGDPVGPGTSEHTAVARSVRDVMRPASWLRADASIQDASQLMAEEQVTAVVIVRLGRVQGIATLDDLVQRTAAGERMPVDAPLAAFCRRPVLPLAAAASIDQAGVAMRTLGVDRLPVVDERGRPVGVLTADDLPRAERPSGDGEPTRPGAA
jgi:CBS domain-containing protein